MHLIQRNITNNEVCAKIQQAIRPHEDLLTIVKRCKLKWYGHISRSSGLAKTILQDTVKGGRRQGRQRKRWEDNIGEWTALEFAKSQRAVGNRGKWRKVVARGKGIDDDDDDDDECVVTTSWDSLPRVFIQSLYKSLPRRCQQVLNMKRHITK